MNGSHRLVARLLAMSGTVLSLSVPRNIQNLYDSIASRSDCSHKLATGFHNSKFEGPEMSYCGDHLEDYGIVYLQGPGRMANMDIDCDGEQGGPEDDGRCDDTGTTIPETSVRGVIEGYEVGISDLNPHVHSFAVFGNSGDQDAWATFDPRSVGIEKASLMAVVCGDQMFYAIWGDSNGDHSHRPSVGEASLSLATACYGNSMNGGQGANSSHNKPDVLYIAFAGEDAVPGADAAAWAAGNFDDFHDSLVSLGDELVERIDPEKAGQLNFEFDCSWPGHCLGRLPIEGASMGTGTLTSSQGRHVLPIETALTISAASRKDVARLLSLVIRVRWESSPQLPQLTNTAVEGGVGCGKIMVVFPAPQLKSSNEKA